MRVYCTLETSKRTATHRTTLLRRVINIAMDGEATEHSRLSTYDAARYGRRIVGSRVLVAQRHVQRGALDVPRSVSVTVEERRIPHSFPAVYCIAVVP